MLHTFKKTVDFALLNISSTVLPHN